MLQNSNCGCSSEQVDLMFKRAEQYIDEQVTDRTYQMARYWVDLFPVKPFLDGVGLTLDKVRFYGDIGPQYDGFDGWRKVQISRSASQGALCGENDGCGHLWEDVGHGMETVSYDLMQRDLRTKLICIKDIRTFWQYQETQNLIFQNLTNISANMREQLNRNAAMMFSIKHVALNGLPTNTSDAHQLPVIPSGVTLGRATYRLFLQLYHMLVQEAAQYAIGNVNGMPAFGLIAHPETLHDMVYEDPEIRKDLRWCQGTSCDLIKRYNFLDSLGPFILMPDLYAPRYDRDINGNLYRVFPFDRNLPIEIGTRPITNPKYHTAEFELVLFMTKDLFNLRSRRQLTSVGGQTDFDSEIGLFEWKWHNPPREDSPYRRTGRYVTTGEIGIEPGDFVDIPAILVQRKPQYVGVEYWAAEVCPPEIVDCDNVLPTAPCPCPRIIGQCRAVADDELVFTFDRDTGLSDSDSVELETVNNSFVAGTVEEVNTDGTVVRISFDAAPCNEIGFFVGIRCLDTASCSAKVLNSTLCGILGTTVTLYVNRLIKATDGDTITLFMGDGTTQDVPITASETGKLSYTVTLSFADYCDKKGVCSVCVPTATDNTCPDCVASDLEDCVDEEIV